MRKFVTLLTTKTLLTAALLVAATVSSAQADDLFSSDSLNRVFNPSQPQTDPAPQDPQSPEDIPSSPEQAPVQPSLRRGLEANDIPAFLTLMGFQSEDLGNGVYKTTLTKGEWTLPYAFVVSPDKSQFWITLSLNPLQEGVTIPQSALLQMLQFNHKFGPIHFAYSGENRRIYVCRAVKNVDLNPTRVRQQIELIADLALKHEEMWNHNKWNTTQQPQAPTQPQVQQQPQPPVQQQPVPKHVGTWKSTAQDGSTFQLTLNADGSFVLYHVKPSKTDKSVGTYTVIGNKLTLIMTGAEDLESYITWYANGTWRFQVKDAQPGATGLLFART